MGKEEEQSAPEGFDAQSALAEARDKAVSFARSGARKSKAGGGIAAAAPALAKDVSEAFGDGSEAGWRKAYLVVGCSAQALAELDSGLFKTIECGSGRALAPVEKRALFKELRLLVDDRLESVIGAALALADFHLGSENVSGLLKELERPEPIGSSMALFGPAAMAETRPRLKFRK